MSLEDLSDCSQDYCDIYKKESGNQNSYKIRTYEKCIDNISKKSSASRDAVKTRLKEIGYKVEGIFEYVDGRYLKSYLHEMKLNYDESYSLSEFDLLC